MDELWSVETGGAEVPMVNISASQKAWRGSTDSIDDKITTAGVVNPSNVPVNSFSIFDQLRSPLKFTECCFRMLFANSTIHGLQRLLINARNRF